MVGGVTHPTVFNEGIHRRHATSICRNQISMNLWSSSGSTIRMQRGIVNGYLPGSRLSQPAAACQPDREEMEWERELHLLFLLFLVRKKFGNVSLLSQNVKICHFCRQCRKNLNIHIMKKYNSGWNQLARKPQKWCRPAQYLTDTSLWVHRWNNFKLYWRW